MEITSLVRGMAWHDIGKPFYLGSDKHSRLGFLLLRAAGYPEEALVALAHGPKLTGNLQDYFELSQAQDELDAFLALTNVLDRVAASTYSFMERGFEPPYHSWQNPFSRLPMYNSPLAKRMVVANNGGSVRVAEIDEALQDRLLKEAKRISQAWHEAVEESLTVAKGGPLHSDIEPVPDGAAFLELVRGYMAEYPERTYPPVNDTSLEQHGRLSGILTFVARRNLADQDAGFLAKRIGRVDGIIDLGDEPLSEFVTRSEDGQRKKYSKSEEVVRDSLDCHLVRIALEGHRELFESAVRLDDLQGARKLVEDTKTILKRTMADELGAPDLTDLLPVSESLFDLIYLFPRDVGDEKAVERKVSQAYVRALQQLVDGDGDNLISRLNRDFENAQPPLRFDGQRRELVEQLHALTYGLRVIPVDSPKDADTFAEFNREFSRRMLDAYRDALEYVNFPLDLVAKVQNILMKEERVPIEDVCVACGTHRVHQEFCRRLKAGDEYLRKVVHTFRGEPELLCVSCIARRILAHAQVKVPDLEKTIDWEEGSSTNLMVEWREGLPTLPPLLLRPAEFESPDDFLDLGAAYVRQRREKDPTTGRAKLDVFPTIGYAADENSNVALISLTHTSALLRAYSYKEALDYLEEYRQVESQPGGKKDKAGDPRDLLDFERGYKEFYEKVKSGQPDLMAQIMTVEPHLARVMERISRLGMFYAQLAKDLTDATIRVLPLETEYPVARLMVPAMDLTEALRVLEKSLISNLFSAAPREGEEEETLLLLSHLLPPLVLGAVVVFKHRQPIYLVLEAERYLLSQLERAAAGQILGRRLEERIGKDERWWGLRLGFTDLRGTLTEKTPWQAQIMFKDLSATLKLAGEVDRRSVESKGVLQSREDMEEAVARDLAEALLYIRADRLRWAHGREKAAQLCDDVYFRPVLFLKKVAR